MKHIKSLLCAVLAAVFILAPAALAAGTEHDTVNPAACSHSWGPTSTGTDYEDVNSSKHMKRSYRKRICTKCGYVSRVITGTVQEVHIRVMTSAICGGTTHYYRYRCDKCRRFMGETTEPCPRPGNCPGLPISMILLPK